MSLKSSEIKWQTLCSACYVFHTAQCDSIHIKMSIRMCVLCVSLSAAIANLLCLLHASHTLTGWGSTPYVSNWVDIMRTCISATSAVWPLTTQHTTATNTTNITTATATTNTTTATIVTTATNTTNTTNTTNATTNTTTATATATTTTNRTTTTTTTTWSRWVELSRV